MLFSNLSNEILSEVWAPGIWLILAPMEKAWASRIFFGDLEEKSHFTLQSLDPTATDGLVWGPGHTNVNQVAMLSKTSRGPVFEWLLDKSVNLIKIWNFLAL